jgi:hypothetical protein
LQVGAAWAAAWAAEEHDDGIGVNYNVIKAEGKGRERDTHQYTLKK